MIRQEEEQSHEALAEQHSTYIGSGQNHKHACLRVAVASPYSTTTPLWGKSPQYQSIRCRLSARALSPAAPMSLQCPGCCNAVDPQQGPWHHQHQGFCRLLQCCRPSARALTPTAPMSLLSRSNVRSLLQCCRPSANQHQCHSSQNRVVAML